MSSVRKRNEPETSKGVYAGSWTYVWLAMGFAAIGLLLVAWNDYVIGGSSTALGTVVSVDKHQSSRGGASSSSTSIQYTALISFTDETGNVGKRTFSTYDYDYRLDEIGKKLEISYSLEDPSYVRIVESSEGWVIPKICFTIAGLWILGFFWIRRHAAKLEAEGR